MLPEEVVEEPATTKTKDREEIPTQDNKSSRLVLINRVTLDHKNMDNNVKKSQQPAEMQLFFGFIPIKIVLQKKLSIPFFFIGKYTEIEIQNFCIIKKKR